MSRSPRPTSRSRPCNAAGAVLFFIQIRMTEHRASYISWFGGCPSAKAAIINNGGFEAVDFAGWESLCFLSSFDIFLFNKVSYLLNRLDALYTYLSGAVEVKYF